MITAQRPVEVAAKPQPPEPLDWGASGWAGLLAGALYVWAQWALAPIYLGGTHTDALRRIAAIVLGQSVLPPLSPFTTLVAFAAASVHIPLSLLYGRLLAGIIHRMRTGAALLAGLAFGAALYLVNFYGMTDVFPWFAASRNWLTFAAHLLYGLSAAGFYKVMTSLKEG